MTPRSKVGIALTVSFVVAVLVACVRAQPRGTIRSKRDVNIIEGGSGPAVIQTGEGSIIIKSIQGIDPEEHRAIAKQLGVTEAALDSFFKIIERKKVPLADLDSTLRGIAKDYQALLERVRTLSADDAQVAQLRDAAEVAIRDGDFDRAERLLNNASERDLAAAQELQSIMTKRLLGAAAAKAMAGDLKRTQLAYAEAAAYYREAAAIVPLGETRVRSEYLNQEGIAWLHAGRYDTAQAALEHALSLREKALGRNHPKVAASLNNLAGLYYHQGRYTEAESLFQRALVIGEKDFGLDHPNIASGLNNLAELYHRQGRYAKAESLFRRALAIEENVLGPDHPSVATSLNNLAGLYRTQGRYAEADPLYQRALAIDEKVLGPEHPTTLTILRNYLAFLVEANRTAKAQVLIARFQAAQPKRGWLGIGLKSQEEPSGILVTQVMDNSPAALSRYPTRRPYRPFRWA